MPSVISTSGEEFRDSDGEFLSNMPEGIVSYMKMIEVVEASLYQ